MISSPRSPTGRSKSAIISRPMNLAWPAHYICIMTLLVVYIYNVSTLDRRHAVPSGGRTGDHEELDPTRAVMMMALGSGTTNSLLVERCHKSIRSRGQFRGPIVLLTDAPVDRYDALSAEDDGDMIVLQFNHAADNLSRTMKPRRVMKRMKTRLLEYLDGDSRLNDVQEVLYLDIDIVVGDSLADMWDYYHGSRHAYGDDNAEAGGSSATPYMYVFDEIANKGSFHTGVMMLDRRRSQPCLDMWRDAIVDANDTFSDQLCLQRAHDQCGNGQCNIRAMARTARRNCEGDYYSGIQSVVERKAGASKAVLGDINAKEMDHWKLHMLYPSVQNMSHWVTPTFAHITNTHRADELPKELQMEYFNFLLNEGHGSNDTKWVIPHVPFVPIGHRN